MKKFRGVLGCQALLMGLFTLSSQALDITEQDGAVTAGESSVQTEAGGRAQLNLPGNVVLRIGAESTLRSSDQEITLSQGTALFDLGLSKQKLVVGTEQERLSVKGGVGFVRYAQGGSDDEQLIVVGVLAGKVTVTANDKSRKLQPGELIALQGGGRIAKSDFNLPRLVESSSLLKDFRSALPSQRALDGELKGFAALEKRGFIRTMATDGQNKLLTAGELNQYAIASIGNDGVVALNSGAGTFSTGNSAAFSSVSSLRDMSLRAMAGSANNSASFSSSMVMVMDEIRIGVSWEDVSFESLERTRIVRPSDSLGDNMVLTPVGSN